MLKIAFHKNYRLIAEHYNVRQRDLEFSLKDIPRTTLLKQLEASVQIVELGLNNLGENQMSDDFPVVIKAQPKMEYTLVHLATHLKYHLGQINYHRRLRDIETSELASWKTI